MNGEVITIIVIRDLPTMMSEMITQVEVSFQREVYVEFLKSDTAMRFLHFRFEEVGFL